MEDLGMPKKEKRRKMQNTKANLDKQSDVDEKSEISDEEFSGTIHREQLKELSKKDPKFYAFLKDQEADLLEFDESDHEETKGNDEEEQETEIMADDDEESVGSDGLQLDDRNRRIATFEYVKAIEQTLCEQERPDRSLVKRLIALFRACAARVGVRLTGSIGFTVNDGNVFDAIIRLCFKRLGKALYMLLGVVKEEVNEGTKDSYKPRVKKHYRRWKKYGNFVKQYLPTFLQFLNELQTTDVIVYTLVAVQELLDLYLEFPKLLRNLTKTLTRIWSRKTEECRCAAFMAICKLVRIHERSYTTVLKSCYTSYVSNVSTVTEETLPLVTFMQMSFAELCLIYPEVCYQYAFVYIRQTAIHLRNAMIAKRKELTRTVYNWQFVQCLYVWARVISKAFRVGSRVNVTGIKELAYPLCQIATATLKLFPSLKYFPLRLHCLKVLLMLQRNCDIYIPSLPLAVELLADALLMLKKKPSSGKGTIKGLNMNCMLKASVAHLANAGYRDAALNELFKLHMEAALNIQGSCAFADVIVPIDGQLKNFVKNCRNVEYARLFKSLRIKLNEHAMFIRERQYTVDMDLFQPVTLQFDYTDAPFNKFYKSYKDVWTLKKGSADMKVGKVPSEASEKSKDGGGSARLVADVKVHKRRRKDGHLNGMKRKRVDSAGKADSKDDVVQDLVLSEFEV